MTKSLAEKAHPSFTEIIKNISPDEAKILQCFKSNNSYPVIDIRTRINKDKIPSELDTVVASIKSSTFFIAEVNISLIGEIAGCAFPDQVPAYLDNLTRLGLLVFPSDHRLGKDSYIDLEKSELVRKAKEKAEQHGFFTSYIQKKKLDSTPFGEQFLLACSRD